MPSRRAALSCLLSPLAFGLPAWAQSAYPGRPAHLVVPFPPGGPSDQVARALGQALGRALGQGIVIDNRPGAEGLLGVRAAAGAPADGYTLLYATASMLALPLVNKSVALDWQKDLVPIGSVGRLAFGMAVHPEVPARTLAEFVEHARAHPGRLNFAASTLSELLAAAQFMKATGVSMTRVAYKGSVQAMPDLLAGRVQLSFTPLGAVLPHVKEGRLRLLATLLPQRSPLAADVPTLAEQGFPQVAVPTWQALFAPAGTPRDIVDRLARELQAATGQAALRQELEQRALMVEARTPAQLAATLADELRLWGELVGEYRLAGD
jgi:tripartite-type tricarboxylate transporter receptor subunit TctC